MIVLLVAALVLGRNGVLLALLLAGAPRMLLIRPSPNERARDRVRSNGSGGFTVVELVLVIALVAVLVSLTLPTLAGVRSRARETVSLSNLRSHGSAFAMYASDWDDVWPYITDPDATSNSFLIPGEGVVSISYFGVYAYWTLGLYADYYGGDWSSPTFNVPGSETQGPISSYWYGSVFLTRPDYWRTLTRRDDRSQWSPTRVDEVLYPSDKGLLLEQTSRPVAFFNPNAGANAYRRIGLVDASATSISESQLRQPIANGTGITPGAPNGGLVRGMPVLHTVDGVRGRDR